MNKQLTTILDYPERNNKYGNNKYRGNCTGELIKDLILYFKPKKFFDPMTGGGTSDDVCNELNINHICRDLNPAWGGWDALNDEIEESSDFIFWHPPYHDIIKYSGIMWGQPDERDLSRCKTYNEFIVKLNKIQAKLITSLRKNGRMAILVGDVKRKGLLYSIQKDMDWYGSPEQIIIKTQHNCFSDRVSYNNSFIPIVHEYLLIFKKEDCYIIPTKVLYNINIDLRKSISTSWKDVVFAAMERLGGTANLNQLYEEIRYHERTKQNQNWKEKIRQVVREYKDFICVDRGTYKLAHL